MAGPADPLPSWTAYRRIIREVTDAVAEWPRYGARAQLDEPVIAAIAQDMARFRPR